MRYIAKNIKIEFAGETVTLPTAKDKATTKSGVVLWVKVKPDKLQAMADIPDGTFDKYIHTLPQCVSAEWVDTWN